MVLVELQILPSSNHQVWPTKWQASVEKVSKEQSFARRMCCNEEFRRKEGRMLFSPRPPGRNALLLVAGTTFELLTQGIRNIIIEVGDNDSDNSNPIRFGTTAGRVAFSKHTIVHHTGQ